MKQEFNSREEWLEEVANWLRQNGADEECVQFGMKFPPGSQIHREDGGGIMYVVGMERDDDEKLWVLASAINPKEDYQGALASQMLIDPDVLEDSGWEQ